MRLLRQCADISLAELLFMRKCDSEYRDSELLSQVLQKRRVIHAECAGVLYGERFPITCKRRSDAYIYPDAQAGRFRAEEKDGAVAVKTTISGILRGLIRDGYPVTKGFKITNIDAKGIRV